MNGTKGSRETVSNGSKSNLKLSPRPIDKLKKLELLKRSLGLRHKLKVHESMKQPESHDELALHLLAKWEFEDELRAIEIMLLETRDTNIALKRVQLEKEWKQGKPPVE